MKIGFYTLGCKLNQTETEAIADSFFAVGHTAVSIHEEADLYIVNTCTVTSKSDQKARRIIRRLLNRYPKASIIATGCYAELEGEIIKSLGERVQVVPGSLKQSLLDLPGYLLANEGTLQNDLSAFLRSCASDQTNSRPFHPPQYRFHSRAFLKIQDGCNHACYFCRVRLARGPSSSASIREVSSQFLSLAEKGYKEVVLTGVNISQYASEGKNLGDLVQILLNLQTGIRVRLSSLEPEAFTPSLLESFTNDRVCPHVHLSVQSASDPILKRMNRPYTVKEIERIVTAIRSSKEDPFLAADLITGFPGETEADHNRTLKFIDAVQFTDLHVFPFSPRKGTKAYTFKPKVPERVAQERGRELSRSIKPYYTAYLERQIGKQLSVLLEDEITPASWVGTSENYLHIEILPEGNAEQCSMEKGRIVNCKILQTTEKGLIGSMV